MIDPDCSLCTDYVADAGGILDDERVAALSQHECAIYGDGVGSTALTSSCCRFRESSGQCELYHDNEFLSRSPCRNCIKPQTCEWCTHFTYRGMNVPDLNYENEQLAYLYIHWSDCVEGNVLDHGSDCCQHDQATGQCGIFHNGEYQAQCRNCRIPTEANLNIKCSACTAYDPFASLYTKPTEGANINQDLLSEHPCSGYKLGSSTDCCIFHQDTGQCGLHYNGVFLHPCRQCYERVEITDKEATDIAISSEESCGGCTQYFPSGDRTSESSPLTNHACAHYDGDMTKCCRYDQSNNECAVYSANGIFGPESLYPCTSCEAGATMSTGMVVGIVSCILILIVIAISTYLFSRRKKLLCKNSEPRLAGAAQDEVLVATHIVIAEVVAAEIDDHYKPAIAQEAKYHNNHSPEGDNKARKELTKPPRADLGFEQTRSNKFLSKHVITNDYDDCKPSAPPLPTPIPPPSSSK